MSLISIASPNLYQLPSLIKNYKIKFPNDFSSLIHNFKYSIPIQKLATALRNQSGSISRNALNASLSCKSIKGCIPIISSFQQENKARMHSHSMHRYTIGKHMDRPNIRALLSYDTSSLTKKPDGLNKDGQKAFSFIKACKSINVPKVNISYENPPMDLPKSTLCRRSKYFMKKVQRNKSYDTSRKRNLAPLMCLAGNQIIKVKFNMEKGS